MHKSLGKRWKNYILPPSNLKLANVAFVEKSQAIDETIQFKDASKWK